eukprot:4308340-Karenia_brevis.AAC.1
MAEAHEHMEQVHPNIEAEHEYICGEKLKDGSICMKSFETKKGLMSHQRGAKDHDLTFPAKAAHITL